MNQNSFLKYIQQIISEKENLDLKSNAIRLLNGECDGLEGFTLDRFDQHYQIQVFQTQAKKQVKWLVEFLQNHEECLYLIEKDRTSKSGASLESFEKKIHKTQGDSKTQVFEGSAKIQVDLEDTVNPGLFLDMRSNRLKVASFCKDQKVFNGFSYTCTFGLHARLKGAEWVANVDISKKILEKGKRNYHLSGVGEKPDFIQMDTLEYMDFCLKKNRKFGVLILDPPTFSRYKGKKFHVWRDFQTLFEKGLALLEQEGHFFFSMNCSEVSQKSFDDKVRELSSKNKVEAKTLWRVKQAQDFSSSNLTQYSHLVGAFFKIKKL